MTRLVACVGLGLVLATVAGSRADAAKQYRVAFVTARDEVLPTGQWIASSA